MSSKNKLIINCTSTSVVAGEFSSVNGRLVLHNFKTQELLYDYSNQEQWWPALEAALKALRMSGEATVIAPAFMLLTKTIKVPNVGSQSQSDVIKFEASKAIPYDLSEVSWDYQEIAKDEVETEILLVPMRTSEADRLCKAVMAAGITPKKLEASSILDYNAWKYCSLEDDVMLLNIGARSSNLIIARSDGFFVRSIPLGGNTFTQAIADSQDKPFEAAEADKINFCNSAEAQKGGNPVADQIIAAVKSSVKRLGMELKRSVLNYRRKSSLKPPTKIYLTGKGSLIPGLAEALSEDQKMSVEYLDVLSHISVGSSVNQQLLSDCSTQVSELIGEAAGEIVPQSVGVNLLPEHIVKDMAFRRKRPLILISAAILAISVLPVSICLKSQISSAESCGKEFSRAIPPLQEHIDTLAANKENAEKLIGKIKDLEVLARSKANWINLFVDLEKRLVKLKDVWLDDLRVVRTGTGAKARYDLELTGKLLIREFNPDNPDAYDSSKAIERVQSLLTSFKESSFIKDYRNVKTDPSNPRILKFDFTLVVNPDKPI